MKYLDTAIIVLGVTIMATASCCDGPTAHITAAVKNAETDCYAPVKKQKQYATWEDNDYVTMRAKGSK